MSCYESERILVFCRSSKCYIEIRKGKSTVLVKETRAFGKDSMDL